MPDETRHESADLTDYSVQEPADSLTGSPGEDPTERGVAPPERWSAAMKFGSTAEEQREGESLDRLLAEEEPDPALELDDDLPGSGDGRSGDGRSGNGRSGNGRSGDAEEDWADEYVDGLLLDDGPDPRAGRLVAEDEG